MSVTLSRVHYVVGTNLPGYLPTADPFVTTSRADAVDALIAEVTTTTESADLPPGWSVAAIRAHVTYALSKGEPFTVIVGGYAHFVHPEV